MCETKICRKCKEEKRAKDFHNDRRTPDGLNRWCKICRNAEQIRYRKDNEEAFKARRKVKYHAQVEKMRENKHKYLPKMRTKKRAYDQIYRKEKALEIAAYKKTWEKERRNKPIFKIKRNLRRRVHHALKGNLKAEKTFTLIGCSAEEFKIYLESQFLPGMTWENYGPQGWHIDHREPCYLFDLTNPNQQRECFHFSNQRPLWAKDNMSRPRADFNYNHSKKPKITADTV